MAFWRSSHYSNSLEHTGRAVHNSLLAPPSIQPSTRSIAGRMPRASTRNQWSEIGTTPDRLASASIAMGPGIWTSTETTFIRPELTGRLRTSVFRAHNRWWAIGTTPERHDSASFKTVYGTSTWSVTMS